MTKRAIQPKGLMNPALEKSRDKTGLAWSHVLVTKGELIFVSGQSPEDENGRLMFPNDIVKQTEAALSNLKTAVESAGATMDDVVNTLWFTTDVKRFYSEGASAVRKRFFREPYPTSTLVGVNGFALQGSMVEVQAIVVK